MPKKPARIVTTDREIEAALARARKFDDTERRAVRATYDRTRDLITVELTNGVTIAIPRQYLQGLQDSPPAQISRIEIVGSGSGLHWPILDVSHYVPALLNHVFGTRKWMAELGRRGGSSTSAAKAAAARRNGKKGGRPKSTAA